MFVRISKLMMKYFPISRIQSSKEWCTVVFIWLSLKISAVSPLSTKQHYGLFHLAADKLGVRHQTQAREASDAMPADIFRWDKAWQPQSSWSPWCRESTLNLSPPILGLVRYTLYRNKVWKWRWLWEGCVTSSATMPKCVTRGRLMGEKQGHLFLTVNWGRGGYRR